MLGSSFLFGAWGWETDANPWMVSYLKATKEYVKKLKDAKKYLTEMLSGWARFHVRLPPSVEGLAS